MELISAESHGAVSEELELLSKGGDLDLDRCVELRPRPADLEFIAADLDLEVGFRCADLRPRPADLEFIAAEGDLEVGFRCADLRPRPADLEFIAAEGDLECDFLRADVRPRPADLDLLRGGERDKERDFDFKF